VPLFASRYTYVTLMTEEAPQRSHPLREVFNGLRWLARAGARKRKNVAGMTRREAR
jgi:hypothetical protein